MLSPLHTAAHWLEDGRTVALATVVKTWGSAPRGPGSVMCIAEDGEFEGSVSGGCVETAVIDEARGVLDTGIPKLLTYGVTNEMAWEVGLACGGSVEVWVERLPDREALVPLLDALERGAPVAREIDLESGAIRLYSSNVRDDGNVTVALAPGSDDARRFVHVVQAPIRVIVVGAVHIAQSLLPMLRAVGYDAVIVDPRTAFATPERFPDTKMVAAWPDRAFADLGLDARTAVVTVTHDPKLDDPALQLALASDAFYIGALGSRRTHAKRVARLSEAGFTEAQIERIHAPIGLDLGARTPGEIAVSIVAQIVGTARAE